MKNLITKSLVVLAFTSGLAQSLQAQNEPRILTFAHDIQVLETDALNSIDCLLSLLENMAGLLHRYKQDFVTLYGSGAYIISNPMQTANEGINLGIDAVKESDLGKATNNAIDTGKSTYDKVSTEAQNIYNKVTGTVADTTKTITNAADNAYNNLKNLWGR